MENKEMYLYQSKTGVLTGKPYVYVCGLEDDVAKYYNQISELLLEELGCVVCRRQACDVYADEDYRPYLAQMRLMIVLASSDFLNTEDSNVLMRELHFAMNNNIPVLPLMVEPIWNEKASKLYDESYSKVFGDAHRLCLFQIDETSMPYKDKLKQFLVNAIGNNQEEQQIRASFRGYIFLSYRKKDRIYVQDVMRAIHADEAFWDYAIWYDENLKAGEDFNEDIRKHLEKSKLFTLLVTPNLFDKPNYVMDEEIPLARDLKKPILAVLPDETLKAKLETESSEQLNETIIALKDVEQLKKRLKDIVDQITEDTANYEADSEWQLEHKYLIGLAYLKGIYAEKDLVRGIELIKKAAEADYIEACSALAKVYSVGIDVERDLFYASEMQEKAINLLSKKIGDFSMQKKLIEEIVFLGDICQEDRDWNKARACYQKGVKSLNVERKHIKNTKEDKVWRSLWNAKIKIKLADLWIAENKEHISSNKSSAITVAKDLVDAIRILESLAKNKDENDYVKELKTAYYLHWLFEIVLKNQSADKAYEKALAIFKINDDKKYISEEENKDYNMLRFLHISSKEKVFLVQGNKKIPVEFLCEKEEIRETLTDDQKELILKWFMNKTSSYLYNAFFFSVEQKQEFIYALIKEKEKAVEGMEMDKQPDEVCCALADLYFHYGWAVQDTANQWEKSLKFYQELLKRHPKNKMYQTWVEEYPDMIEVFL